MTFSGADRVGVIGGYIGGINALLGNNCGGGLGSILGGGNNNCNTNCCESDHIVTRYEAKQAEKLGAAQDEIARLQAEKYTDNKIDNKIAILNDKFEAKLDKLAERVCYDERLIQKNADAIIAEHCYVEAHYVKGEMKLSCHDIFKGDHCETK